MSTERPDSNSIGKEFDTDIGSVACKVPPKITRSGLPQRWHLQKTKTGKLRSDLNIGTEDGTILNAVATRLGLRSGVAIYQGQDKDSDYLATAKISTLSIVVSLPGLEASHGQEIKMKSHWFKSVTPRVEWQMPVGADGHLEGFEWANSNGSWKLTRSTPNGNEIVARWNISFSSIRLSGEFEFIGAGATGELGMAFPYVASISALAIAKLLRDTVQTYSGVAYAGVAASGAD